MVIPDEAILSSSNSSIYAFTAIFVTLLARIGFSLIKLTTKILLSATGLTLIPLLIISAIQSYSKTL